MAHRLIGATLSPNPPSPAANISTRPMQRGAYFSRLLLERMIYVDHGIPAKRMACYHSVTDLSHTAKLLGKERAEICCYFGYSISSLLNTDTSI